MRLLNYRRSSVLTASLLSLLLLSAGVSHSATPSDTGQLEVVLKVENMT